MSLTLRQERRIWTERDRRGNVVEHFDVIETWARLPGLGVWILVGSVPTDSMPAGAFP